MNIGLFGFGTVGSGVYDIAQRRQQAHRILAIGVKSPEKPRPAGLPFTRDPEVILADARIHTVIEAISDTEVGYQLVRTALERGKHVVSASKALLALHLPELHELAAQHGVSLRYEAAVGGAIPVLDTIDRYLAHEPITAIRGILNGTTNYILTRMEREGLAFEQALADAQRLGFAELDPSADVDGLDARNKLVLLAYQAFGVHLPPQQISTTGIRSVSRADILAARAQGGALKLVAEVRALPEGTIQARVAPQVVTADDPLYAVAFERNAVAIESEWGGPFLLGGRGAGALPTGTAVTFDLDHIDQPYRVTRRLAAATPALVTG